MLPSTVFTKTIIFLKNYLQGTDFLLRENVWAASIFAWTEEMKKATTFSLIISKEAVTLLRISLLREGTLMNLQRFCINFCQHGDYYNFSDSQGLVSDFLTVFENAFIPQPNLSRVQFKCSFTIINRQPTPLAKLVELTDSRVWQTNVYEGGYFKKYVKANLAQDVLNCVIINAMSWSSWRFKRFDRLCLTVNSDKFKNISY